MEATAKGDHVAAANAMRVAVGLSPDDAEVQQLASAAQARADSILSETYTNQAQYEEKNERWVEAARSWGRARRGRPNDAHVHERAAHAIIKAGGDLHEAERLAQRSCELAPSLAAPRVTLAEVYLAAGLPLKARRVLETAAQAAPHDASIQAMLEKLFKPG
jgi:predicted Zn-dependent protease